MRHVQLRAQAAEAEVVQEERTVPGEDPGIYACDYKKLARIQLLTAAGRLALLAGNHSAAEVRALFIPCALTLLFRPFFLSPAELSKFGGGACYGGCHCL